MSLKNPCNYSFADLVKASGNQITLELLYSISQNSRNDIVKQLCKIAGWYTKDRYVNGQHFVAFSPEIYEINLT